MTYICPLNEDELAHIESGGHVQKVYGIDPIRVMIIHNGELSYKDIQNQYEVIWKSGDDLINFPLEPDAIKTLRAGEKAVTRGYKDKKTDKEDAFKVLVLTQAMHEEVMASQEKDR